MGLREQVKNDLLNKKADINRNWNTWEETRAETKQTDAEVVKKGWLNTNRAEWKLRAAG